MFQSAPLQKVAIAPVYELHYTKLLDLMNTLFMGDQLTVERARKSKELRVNSTSVEDALMGLEPSVCDWHAEFNFLQVFYGRKIDYVISNEPGRTYSCLALFTLLDQHHA